MLFNDVPNACPTAQSDMISWYTV